MILKWFKRYQPKTSDGLTVYTNRLIENDPILLRLILDKLGFFKIYLLSLWRNIKMNLKIM